MSNKCYSCGRANTYISYAGYNTSLICRDCHAEEHRPMKRILLDRAHHQPEGPKDYCPKCGGLVDRNPCTCQG